MWETVVPIALAAAIMTSLINVASRVSDMREMRQVNNIGTSLTDGVEPLVQQRSPPVDPEAGA